MEVSRGGTSKRVAVAVVVGRHRALGEHTKKMMHTFGRHSGRAARRFKSIQKSGAEPKIPERAPLSQSESIKNHKTQPKSAPTGSKVDSRRR